MDTEPVSAEGTVDQEMTTACSGGPYGEITVEKRDGWSIEAAPVDSGKLSYGHYGLILKPDGLITAYAVNTQRDRFCRTRFITDSNLGTDYD